ncbi:MAG: hypothetical protein ACYTF1_25640 [Planctomycetota bacterium]|jgi:hypothetical protein
MKYRLPWLVVFGLVLLAGCGPKGTRIELTSFDEMGIPQRHYTDFSRAYYRTTSAGTLELVLRSDRPRSADPTQNITQIVYLKSFWKVNPGMTHAEATQINARLQYAVLTSPDGIRYDGAAFVHYKVKRKTNQMVGTIEAGTLSPRYRMGNAVDPFGPCRLEGTFQAEQNARVVVDTLQMLETQFSKQKAIPEN